MKAGWLKDSMNSILSYLLILDLLISIYSYSLIKYTWFFLEKYSAIVKTTKTIFTEIFTVTY